MNLTAGYAIRDDTVLVTARGHERLREELQRMCADGRQEMAEQLRQARPRRWHASRQSRAANSLGRTREPGAANSRDRGASG